MTSIQRPKARKAEFFEFGCCEFARGAFFSCFHTHFLLWAFLSGSNPVISPGPGIPSPDTPCTSPVEEDCINIRIQRSTEKFSLVLIGLTLLVLPENSYCKCSQQQYIKMSLYTEEFVNTVRDMWFCTECNRSVWLQWKNYITVCAAVEILEKGLQAKAADKPQFFASVLEAYTRKVDALFPERENIIDGNIKMVRNLMPRDFRREDFLYTKYQSRDRAGTPAMDAASMKATHRRSMPPTPVTGEWLWDTWKYCRHYIHQTVLPAYKELEQER
jgi:hypothetical protein